MFLCRPPERNARSVYIGLLKQGPEYVWLDRTPLETILWAAQEPDDVPHNANCVGMKDDALHRWEDVSCTETKNFLCEKMSE